MKRKIYAIYRISLIVFTMLIFNISLIAQTETLPTGSFIINMGATNPNTVGNGLKPYGLIYDLIRNNSVPIKWVIGAGKVKDGVDFTLNGIQYRGGTFIIPAQYRTAAVNAKITAWQAQGVVGTTTASPLTVNVTQTLTASPRWTLDATNGAIAEKYMANAGITNTAFPGAYNGKSPQALGPCDDLYVMPHADPEWSTHSNLFTWNQTSLGSIWAACHAVSALENSINPANNTQQMNFLSTRNAVTTPAVWPNNSLTLWTAHVDGTPPYIHQYFDDPVAQYMGTTDGCFFDNGSEDSYLPKQNAVTTRWRPGVKIISYDPTHPNVLSPNLANGNVAALIVYGRGFDDPNRGYVMYEAGHDHTKMKGATGDVAAQRAYFNFSFFQAQYKSPNISVTGLTSGQTINSGQVVNVSASATSPLPAITFTYLWTSSCGGTFANATAATTTFTAPTVLGSTPCVLTCKVTDNCGRAAFQSYPVNILPSPLPPVATPDNATVSIICGSGTAITTNVLANDSDPRGLPLTLTSITGAVNGTLSFTAAGNVTFTPNSNFSGSMTLTYIACNNATPTALCDTSTLTITATGASTPAAANDAYTIAEDVIGRFNVLANDAVGLSVIGITSGPSNGRASINIDNTISYLPNVDYAGTDIFTYKVSDGTGGFNTATVTVTIINDECNGGTKYTPNLIANGMNASDVIGQYTTAAGFTVRYTNGTANNAQAATNALGLSAPTRYLVDTVGHRAFVADYSNNRVLVYNLTTSDSLADKTPDFVLGQPNFTSNGLTITVKTTVQPQDLAYDYSTKRLFVAQQGARRVSVFNMTTIANNQDAINVLCQTDFVSNFSLRTDSIGGWITALAFDPVRKWLFVGDGPINHRVLVFDVNSITNGEDAIHVLGQPDFYTGGSGLTNAKFNSNTGMVYNEATGNLFVADGTNNRVLVFDVNSITNGEAAINVLGQPDFVTGTAANTQAGMSAPAGLAYDYVNNWLFVAGTGNNRVTVYDAATITNGENAIYVLGQSNFTNSAAATTQSGLSSPRKLTFHNRKLFVPEVSNNRIVRYDLGICATIPTRAPMAMPDEATVQNGASVNIPTATNDYYPVAGALAYSIITPPASGTASINATTGVITYSNNTTYNGVRSLTYRVNHSGSGLSDTATVYINITNGRINAEDLVYIQDQNPGLQQKFYPKTFATDPEGMVASSTLSIVTPPKNGTATVVNDSIIYTRNPGYSGKDTLFYRLCEPTPTCGSGFCDTARLIITVANLVPNSNPFIKTILPCYDHTFTLVNSATDPENGVLTITNVSALSPGSSGTLVNNNDGTLTLTPATGFTGIVKFTYTVTDNGVPPQISTPDTVTITVQNPVNNPPVALNDTEDTIKDQILYANVTGNDSDPNNHPLTIPTIISAPLHGTAVVNSINGLIEYTPDTGYVGLDSLRYAICDIPILIVSTCTTGPDLCDTATLIIPLNSLIPLPVEMAYMKCESSGKATTIKWATASETDSREFIIWRSQDGRNWKEINRVPAAGYSYTMRQYSYSDDKPLDGRNFYRLEQLNINGSSKISGICLAKNSMTSFNSERFSLYPNPTSSEVRIVSETENIENVEVTDINGKSLIVKTINDSSAKLDVSHLAPGMYFVKVNEKVFKLIKE